MLEAIINVFIIVGILIFWTIAAIAPAIPLVLAAMIIYLVIRSFSNNC